MTASDRDLHQSQMNNVKLGLKSADSPPVIRTLTLTHELHVFLAFFVQSKNWCRFSRVWPSSATPSSAWSRVVEDSIANLLLNFAAPGNGRTPLKRNNRCALTKAGKLNG